MINQSNFYSDHNVVVLDGNNLTIENVVEVARKHAKIALLSSMNDRGTESRHWIERVVSGEIKENDLPLAVYGVNTPYGSLAFKNIFRTPEDAQKLSRNVVMSHSAGVGRYFTEDIVRSAMLIRANTLVKGFSGIRLEIINSLIQMLNVDIFPAIPEKGSVGASGDLAPLSHLALILSKPPTGIDEEKESGEVLIPFDVSKHNINDCVMCEDALGQKSMKSKVYAKKVIEDAGIHRLILHAKEGVALNNGPTFSTAMAALNIYDAELLVKNAEIALGMSLEAVCGYRDAFFPHIHKARGHLGQIISAENVMRLVEGSTFLDGDLFVNPKHAPPQDAYSIRCAPQVIGAIRDVLNFIRGVVETELNAATDNPLIFASTKSSDEYYLPRLYKAISGGNFHGEPLAFAMDFLGIAIAELGNIAERRIFRLLTETLNRNLEAMLVYSPEGELGMHNGLMVAQFTAAALVSDNKTLAHPDSVDSIPTCEDQEDHVSMSPNAGRHAHEIIWNVQQIIGIEMLCAAQALDFRREQLRYEAGKGWEKTHTDYTPKLGKGTNAAHDYFRRFIKHWEHDRVLYPDISKASSMIYSGEIVKIVEDTLGSPLK